MAPPWVVCPPLFHRKRSPLQGQTDIIWTLGPRVMGSSACGWKSVDDQNECRSRVPSVKYSWIRTVVGVVVSDIFPMAVIQSYSASPRVVNGEPTTPGVKADRGPESPHLFRGNPLA